MVIKQLAHDEGLSENISLLLEPAGRVHVIKYHQGITQSCTNMALSLRSASVGSISILSAFLMAQEYPKAILANIGCISERYITITATFMLTCQR